MLEGKPRKIYRLLGEALLVFFVFFALAYQQTHEAYLPNKTMAFPGDGYGTIAGIYDIHETIRDLGWRSLFSDQHFSQNMGAGINLSPDPVNVYWKLFHWIGGYFAAPDDIYDFAISQGIFFLGVGFYFLGRTLSLPVSWAMVLGAFPPLLDSFFFRTVGHLTLATFGFCAVGLGMVLLCIQKPSFLRFLGLSFALVASFLNSEYLGYFGIIICFGTVLVFLIIESIRVKSFPRENWLAFLGAISLFCFVIFTLYPNMIFSRLLGIVFTQSDSLTSFAQPASDFKVYAIRHPGSIFETSFSWLQPWQPELFTSGAGLEFTFRLGMIVPLISIIGSVAIFLRRGSKLQKYQIGMLWLSIFIAICLSLQPGRGLSLAPLTQLIAPMLRCGARALTYTNIAFLGIFVWSLYFFYQWSLKLKWAKIGVIPLIFLCLWGAAEELKLHGNILDPVRTSHLTFHPNYHKLRSLPDGQVLELPFHHPAVHVPENDYPYFLARTVHQKPIVNGMSFGYFGEILSEIASKLQQPNDQLIQELKESGIRYIIIHRRDSLNPESYMGLRGITAVISSPEMVIYEIVGAPPFSIQSFYRNFIHFQKKIWSGTEQGSAFANPGIVSHPFVSNKNIRYISHHEGPLPIHLSYGSRLRLEPGSYRATFTIFSKNMNASSKEVIAELQIKPELSPVIERNVRLFEMKKQEMTHFEIDFLCEQIETFEFSVVLYKHGQFYHDSTLVVPLNKAIESDIMKTIQIRNKKLIASKKPDSLSP